MFEKPDHMQIIKEQLRDHTRRVIRTNCHGQSFDFYSYLVGLAKSDFPGLEDKDIECVVFGGQLLRPHAGHRVQRDVGDAGRLRCHSTTGVHTMMRECCGRRTSLDHAPSCLVRRRPAAIATIANWYGLDPDDAGKWLDGAIKCALRKRTRRERESTVLVLELRDTCPTPRWRGGLFDDFQGSIPDPRRLTTNRRETCTA